MKSPKITPVLNSNYYKEKLNSGAKGEMRMSLDASYKWFNNKTSFPDKFRGKWVSIANKRIIESANNVVDLVKKTEDKTQTPFLIARIPIKGACMGLRFLK